MRASLGILAAILVVGVGSAGPVRAAAVDYLYLESNVGGSSGGHVALRFGEVVFDYRLGDLQTLRLHRSDADSFRYGAQVLGNRTIHVARVEVAADRHEALLRRFHRRYLIANRSFQWLDAVRAERRWLEDRPRGASVRRESPGRPGMEVAGAGFFDLAAPADVVSPALAALRARIEEHHGAAFLAGRIAAFEGELSRLRPPSDGATPSFAPDAWPQVPVLFLDRQRELVQWIVGLRTLQRAAPLRPEALRSDDAPDLALGDAERRALAGYAAGLAGSLVELTSSPRDDAGLALLVGLARLEGIGRSLAAGRLRLLDAFPPDAEPIADGPAAGKDPFLAEWETHAAGRFAAARARLADPTPLREQDYARIEATGNRFLELREGRAGRRAIRDDERLGAPAPTGVVADLPLPALSEAERADALAAAQSREARAERALRESYGYRLITRNCVTELFATIDGSLREPGASLQRGRLAFVPFVSFDWFAREHEIAGLWEEPSLRRARVAALSREENDLLVFAREANTLSSTIYRRHDGDGLFLFFTDDRPLLRPLFGVFNLAAGVAQSLYGVVRAPFDGGRTLRVGVAAAGYSLPELLFVNIRKGTLRYGPGAWPPETEGGSQPPST